MKSLSLLRQRRIRLKDLLRSSGSSLQVEIVNLTYGNYLMGNLCDALIALRDFPKGVVIMKKPN